MKKYGFTLAEVLITLTILGVVAAITIPSLIKTSRKKETETKIKEAYSIIVNTLDAASAANNTDYTGIINNSYKNGGVEKNGAIKYFAENYFIPYLNVNQICYAGDDYCNLFPDYAVLDLEGNNLGGASMFHTNYYVSMQLKNGMLFNIHPSVHNMGFYFYVNLYGKTMKNQLGKDVFNFLIMPDNAWGCGYNAIGTGVANSYCTKLKNGKCEGIGLDCFAPIYRNGFKIPKDYPIKKW